MYVYVYVYRPRTSWWWGFDTLLFDMFCLICIINSVLTYYSIRTQMGENRKVI